jgi:hypothetical protein
MVAAGCGRFGFTSADGGIPTSGDDGASCTASASAVSEGSTRATAPKLSWNGTKVGVSWLEDPSPASAHFRTVSLDGAADPIANLGAAGEPVQVAWDGTSWRLAWSTSATKPDIMLSTDGAAPLALTANPRSDAGPRIASLPGGQIAYLWRTDAATSNVRLTVVDAAGNKLVDDLGIATATFEAQAHSLVWTGSELVAFYPMTPSVMMLRMTPKGLPIAAATAAMTLPASQNLFSAVASWAGDRFLIAYASGSGTITSVYVSYVSPSGTTLVPGVFVASGSALDLLTPSIAGGPATDALVWEDPAARTSSLVEVFRDGTLGRLYSFEGASDPSVAWLGTTWAVALAQAQPATATMPTAKPDYTKLIRFCP